MREEAGKANEIIIAPALWIEVVSGLPDVLAAAGFDQPIDSVITVVAARLDLFTVVKNRVQRLVFDARNVPCWVICVTQVLYDCRIGEEL